MISELELRREIRRGNAYLDVINYAIRLLNEHGDHEGASWVVQAREQANRKAEEV